MGSLSEMFLCTLSLVVCTSAQPRVTRTAGEGHAWCNAARWTQLGLNHPQLCPDQALVTPKPIPALWEGQCCGQGRGWQGHEGEGSPSSSSSLLWGRSGSRDFCTVGGQSLQAVLSADGQRGCLPPPGCPTHWQPLTLQHGHAGGTLP